MKITVGLPVYDRKLDYELARCLLAEQVLAQELGDRLIVRFLPSCTNLAMGRNQLVKDFLESGDDRLVFLDSDVTFAPGSLIKIAHYPEEFVGGGYRFKLDTELYPVAFFEDKPLWANEHGLLEVKMVPTGFMSLSRKVFEKFDSKFPNRKYCSLSGEISCYFQIPYKDGILYTEDGFFCEEWREMGGKIYLDPELELTHWNGNIPFKGHIGKWLKSKITPEILEKAKTQIPQKEIA